jgi:predicted O-linked N-acetylglucosamine transferase (SPINDLY family)
MGSATPPAADPRIARMISQGAALHRAGRLADAERIYRDVLRIQPDHVAALNLMAAICIERGQREEVVSLLDRSLGIDPRQVEVAVELGNAQHELGRHGDALASYDRALALKPDHAEAFVNRGVALQELQRYDDALSSFNQALAIRPDFFEAYANRAVLLNTLRRYGEALADHERSILLRPTDANVHYNRGNTLRDCRLFDEAVAAYDKAIALNGSHASAYYNRGLALQEMERYEEAVRSFDRALAVSPRHPYVRGDRLYARQCLGAWEDWGREVREICAQVEEGVPVSQPFPLLAVPAGRRTLRLAAERYVADRYPAIEATPRWDRYVHDRVRLGYFSADFHGHPTAYLLAELIERHDRSRFEVIGFSFGPDRADEFRGRLKLAFDQFHDVRTESDAAIAALSRKLEIDVAIDLKGLTWNCRPGVFALRAAPVQVNYLGYPGTTGSGYHDYLIADPVVVPSEHAADYSERIVLLPDTYQSNDTQRRFSDAVPGRAEMGLPDTAFVFCCFNNVFKITPDVFDVWMRVLGGTDGSVLWLLDGGAAQRANLRREARRRNIPEERLVFAPRVEPAEHLARHRHADLFLDTFHYNAHTTASDALWAGLPVLTRLGDTFAGRVAASLLQAIGLPELIARTAEEYEAKALELAADRAPLEAIREKLARNRLTQPLFDIQRFTRHIEAAYLEMRQRYQAGLDPAPIRVQEQAR